MKDDDRPVGNLKVVDDFLPPPEKLHIPDDLVKVTIALDRHSLDFFKRHAQKLGTKYQKMIRQLLRTYAARYS